MEESENDKSEQATSFKLERARRKGAVARGSDLGFLTGLAAFSGLFWIVADTWIAHAQELARSAWIGGMELADGNHALLSSIAALAALLVAPLVMVLLTIFCLVLLFELVQTGFVFSAEPLTPDLSRLNPSNAIKRVFSLRALIETLKNILKLVVYSTAGILVARAALHQTMFSAIDVKHLGSGLREWLGRLLAAFVLGAVVFAILDQLIARNTFARRMRMSRREVRREAREREGEPRLKQKRRQAHRELTKASQSLRNLRKSDVLITNPEHIAIGLHYVPKVMSAPRVVAVGTNHLAQRLKRLAFLYSIPTIENRALAQALYRAAPLNSEVPRSLFQPIADVYNTVRRQENSHV
jgi:flagellar biosynthetic protein FlhB